jgi:hypothetical protein
MDILFINLVLAIVSPFLFWYVGQRTLGLLQVPFIIAMFVMLPQMIPFTGPQADSSFWFWALFYFNMAFSYLAMGIVAFRWARYFWGEGEEKEKEQEQNTL